MLKMADIGKDKNFNTAILIITFNRPDHTQRVWSKICEHQPSDIYVFRDGPRIGNENDLQKCNEIATFFTNKELPWGGRIHTFFSDENLGCGKGPVTAMNWFFQHVEQGIIMEDDCLAHDDFFMYCQELLTRYRDSEVMAIGATTYHDNYPCEKSYCFSKYFTGGAWATWRRAWLGFDMDLLALRPEDFKVILSQQFYSNVERKWWFNKAIWIKNDQSKKSYWDYQMQIHILMNKGIVIRPQLNMISNIGFDDEGTHTHEDDGRGNRPVFSCLPFSHPLSCNVNTRLDYIHMAKEHRKRMDQYIVSSIYTFMMNDTVFLNKALMSYKRIKQRWKNK